jgi:hypothetical protein
MPGVDTMSWSRQQQACPVDDLTHTNLFLTCAVSYLTDFPMVEPIGLASGLLALVTFALQSSTTLYNTVQSFQSHPKRVRDLIVH